MLIDKKDIITCESYKNLCDEIYKPGMEPKSGLWHVNMEELPAFIEAIKGRTDRYVVVSSCSDFGLCYQQQHPVFLDLPKWTRMGINSGVGYDGINVSPRCDLNKCNINDKFSSKCYAFTAFTFPEIPENIIHWFITNSSISPQNESRISVIPFGVKPNAQDDIMEIAEETRGYEKLPKTYINWVNYTLERLEIKEYYRLLGASDITIIDEAKPYKSYLRDLAMHATVLSPKGNGIDCYRMLETMYMGSMPVVELSETTAEFADLPLLITKTMYGLRAGELYSYYKHVKSQNRSLDKIKLSYWKNKLKEARKFL